MLDRLDAPPRATAFGSDQELRHQHEQRILRRLTHIPGVSRPAGGSGSTAVPPPPGVRWSTLADRVRMLPPLTVAEQVDLAVDLAATLAAVHRAGVTHGDLNAANVVLVGEPPKPVIIGFGYATTVAEQEPAFSHHSSLPETLATIAPEQTGRTGHPVDQRADLYGLGATLYQAVTGSPPFEQPDPLRLVHDVLARMPVPPVERVPGTPPTLSAIVMRLLEKGPDLRYQSAEGVAHDLRRLRAELARGGAGNFPLGEHDFPRLLSAPGRLVGRRAELATLQTALADAVRGTRKTVLVSGQPGVGKTALINQLRPAVTALGGWFVSGKFDQYRRDLATDAVSQALRALGRLMLTEPEADLLRHRARLRAAVGDNADLIASTQPEIALVLGVTARPAAADGAHARDRIVRAGLDVLRAVANPERPVVVVFDDLQWASETSIGLLDVLAQEDAWPGLLVVGAYRSGEVDATHPLTALLPRWSRSSVPPVRVRLENLPAADLGEMIAEMLRLPVGPARALGDVVGARTGGNPFDTVTLLNALREDGALVRDVGGWQWDEPTLRRHVGEGDVVDLVAARIERLPGPTAMLLRRMSCIGGEADADLLGVIGGFTAQEVTRHLEPALADGLLVLGQGGAAGTTPVARFRHDRVQQAATVGLGRAGRTAAHLALARRLAPLPQYAGIAAEQYLPVLGEVVDPAERHRVVELFRAAAYTLRLINPTMTERFLAAALTMLDGAGGGAADGAEDVAGLRLAIEREHHSALYRLGRLAEADERYRSIERLRPATLDLVGSACERISSLTFRERPTEAVALGLDLLRRLGVEVPDDEQLGPWTEQGLARLRAWAEQDGTAADLDRPEADDPLAAAVANLVSRMIPPAFFVGMPIVPWLVFECQRLWAEYGPCPALVGPLGHASFVTIMLDQDHRTGYAAVRRVLTVCENHRHQPESSHARLMLALSSAHWFEPLETVVEYAQRALDGLIRGGDLQNAGFAGYALVPMLLECTPTLAEYLGQVDARLAFAAGSGNDQTLAALVGYRQLALALLGRTAGPGVLSDDSFDTRSHLARYADNPVASSYAHLAHAVAAAIAADAPALAEHSAAALALLPVYEATLSTAVVRLLRAVSLAEALRGHAPLPAGPAAALVELDRLRQWLAVRAVDAPGNFEHLLYLVDAERAWSTGEFLDAAQAFDAAMRTVHGRQRPWHAAFITERAAAFHLAHGLERSGGPLLAEARDLYQAWGAVAKVRAMESAAAVRVGTGGRHRLLTDDAVDLRAILRACQALSSETSLDRLYTRVKDALSAATGATDVRIALWRDEPQGWLVPTGQLAPTGQLGVAGQLGAARDPAVALDDPRAAELVPLSAFRYAERTREPLLVADVACDPRFSTDPYLRTNRCRSLLVVPILSHGAPRAMLLLEHRLAGGAFTADRLGAVRLIAGQFAVSVENAIVYEELEQRVRQRTTELRAAQGELIARARQVGMAEIATNILHNVGNVLTSVNVSAGLAVRRVSSSRIDGLLRAVVMLREHQGDLAEFLTRDERGRLLPEYLGKVAEALAVERQEIADELDRLATNIDHIVDIVAIQQTHASVARLNEPVDVAALVEDAIRINAEALERHRVTVVRRFAALPTVLLDKVRLLLILVNLIGNAKAAMAAVTDRPRTLTLSVALSEPPEPADLSERPERVEPPEPAILRIAVADCGEGIRTEHLARIFTHGFTTRAHGHGFGLHSCSLAAGEMGGTLQAHSDGPGRGATFVLELPVTIEGDPC